MWAKADGAMGSGTGALVKPASEDVKPWKSRWEEGCVMALTNGDAQRLQYRGNVRVRCTARVKHEGGARVRDPGGGKNRTKFGKPSAPTSSACPCTHTNREGGRARDARDGGRGVGEGDTVPCVGWEGLVCNPGMKAKKIFISDASNP